MDFKDKKVLVTGGAGFIGSHLVDALVEQGAHITAIDNLHTGNIKNIVHNADKINFKGVDILNSEAVNKAMEGQDYVFHLAAIADPRECDSCPEFTFQVNVAGTFNILSTAYKSGVKKVVFMSTAHLYGNPKYLPIDEKHPLGAYNVYTFSKKAGEDLCEFFLSKYKLPVMYFRLFNVFGPRQNPSFFIPTMITQAIQKGKMELWTDKPTRDFVFIEDVVNASMMGALSEYIGGAINIGSGNEHKEGDMAKVVADSLGVEMTFLNKEVTGPMRLCCDNRKAQDVLSWKPKTSLPDGLKKTTEWYRKNPNYFNKN